MKLEPLFPLSSTPETQHFIHPPPLEDTLNDFSFSCHLCQLKSVQPFIWSGRLWRTDPYFHSQPAKNNVLGKKMVCNRITTTSKIVRQVSGLWNNAESYLVGHERWRGWRSPLLMTLLFPSRRHFQIFNSGEFFIKFGFRKKNSAAVCVCSVLTTSKTFWLLELNLKKRKCGNAACWLSVVNQQLYAPLPPVMCWCPPVQIVAAQSEPPSQQRKHLLSEVL